MKGKRLLALLVCIAMLGCNFFAFAAPETNPAVPKIPEIISEAAVLMDAKTGQVLYDKEMHKKMYPASITKIMTTILGVEKGNLSDKMTISKVAVDSVARNASHIALTEGEVITLEEAIYAALLVSANDSCNGIGEYISGSIPAFAKLMTEKAAEFGAQGTHFNNTNGLKDSEHYTTAYDMAMITRHGLQNATWRKMFGTLRYDMPANNKQKEKRIFYNQHSMISDPKFQYQGIIGGKAGYTTVAKYTLVTAAERNGVELIAVVMSSPKLNDKYKDTKALLDYGFENFRSVSIDENKIPNQELTDTAADGKVSRVHVKSTQPIQVLLRKDVAESMIATKCELTKDQQGELSPVLKVSLPQTITVMPTAVATIPLEVETVEAVAPIEQKRSSDDGSTWQVAKIVLYVAGAIIALASLFIVFLYIRKRLYRRRRRMRRRR